eukprot:PhF_6_TR9508/c0_g1_i1/m.14819/K12180/COPS7, CSN7; COP9 signalosome complex subunit 7
MLQKLRELTVVHLASRNRVLPYDTIMKAVGIADVRELEDLVIDTITHDLIKAKLDQRARIVELHDVVGCDVSMEDLPAMINALVAWDKSCERTLQAIQGVSNSCGVQFENMATDAKKQNEKKEKTLEELKKTIAENVMKMGGPTAIDEVMAIMVMGEEELSRAKGRKRGGPGPGDMRGFLRPL